MPDLLSTADAARVLGAGPTSVKRWADTGVLDCVRTAGGHRRFTREALDRFMRLRELGEPVVEELQRWVDLLISDASHELALLRARRRASSWHRVSEELAPVLRALRFRWQTEATSFGERRGVSERLSRALSSISDSLHVPPNAERALLVCIEPEEDDLPLYLAEVCLKELGWAPCWLGASVPSAEITRQVAADERIRLVYTFASEKCRDADQLRNVYTTVGSLCQRRGAAIVLAGDGAWPEVPRYGTRSRCFRELEGLSRRGRSLSAY